MNLAMKIMLCHVVADLTEYIALFFYKDSKASYSFWY